MDLILWRHAEAEDAADALPDSKRRLTGRGEKQARLMARWLREYVPKKQLRILAGPTQRAQMTAHALGLPFEVDRKIRADADVADLLAVVNWPDQGGTTIVVGHQPTLGKAASFLISGREDNWTVKRGGIWWLSSRIRDGGRQTVLRAVIDPRFLRHGTDKLPHLRDAGCRPTLKDADWVWPASAAIR